MYIDTSVAVKLYLSEPDSGLCEEVVSDQELYSSRLLYCEFMSALHGKVSRGKLSPDLAREVWRTFVEDTLSNRIEFAALDDAVVKDATEILRALPASFQLRTLDAIHLATYLASEAGPLFTKDLRMIHVARALGIELAS
jgi:predicted nucleic acid-binding protein